MTVRLATKLSLVIYAFLLLSCRNDKTRTPIGNKLNSGDSASATTNKGIDSTGFPAYWKDFRKAVLSYDTSKLVTLTHFPIQTRGIFDSDPIIEYSKKQFPAVFYCFMEQYSGDQNGSAEFDLVKSTEIPKEEITHGQVRIGDMWFFLKNKKWELRFLYLDEETRDSIMVRL